MRNFKYYIYLDKQLIDSIISQLNNETVSEIKITEKNSKTKSFGIKAGISKIFNAGASISRDSNTSNQLEKTLHYSYEQKIEEIINTLSQHNNYYTTLDAAIHHDNDFTDDIKFINICDTFYSRYNIDSPVDREYLETLGYMVFEKGDLPLCADTNIVYKTPVDYYNYNDDYYKESRRRIVMSMNINKMTTGLSSTSHLSVALRMGKGQIRLGIFGQIRRIQNLYYQIKPISVCWLS